MRQAKRSRAHWLSVFAEQAASGQTQAAFCAAHGLSASTFSNARRRARAAGIEVAESNGCDFVEITPGDVESSTPGSQGWDFELALGSDVVLRIRSR